MVKQLDRQGALAIQEGGVGVEYYSDKISRKYGFLIYSGTQGASDYTIITESRPIFNSGLEALAGGNDLVNEVREKHLGEI